MGQLRALAARLRALDEAAAAAEPVATKPQAVRPVLREVPPVPKPETAASPPEPWPEGVDYHLTRDAARLSGLIAAGCGWRSCPAGGLDVTLPDGRLLLISPATVARLREARLLFKSNS
jgi:hypothetical protein